MFALAAFAVLAFVFLVALSQIEANSAKAANKNNLQNGTMRAKEMPAADLQVQDGQALPKYNECESGQVQQCTFDGGCMGKKTCYNSKWSQCVLGKVCRSGQKVLCTIDECKFGIKTCNECGDGWGECVENSQCATCQQ